MKATDQKEAETIADLAVERYFNHYLTEIFPDQLDRIIASHDCDNKAHGSIVRKVSKMKWLVIGAATVFLAGAGVSIPQLLRILNILK